MPLLPPSPCSSLRRSFLALLFVATALIAAAEPTGVWKLNLQGPDGRTLPSTLTLTSQEGRLTGTISNRAGEVDISEGRASGDQITFRVVREWGRRLRKKSFVSDYTATLQGDSLEGSIQTVDRKGRPRTVPFTATRVR